MLVCRFLGRVNVYRTRWFWACAFRYFVHGGVSMCVQHSVFDAVGARLVLWGSEKMLSLAGRVSAVAVGLVRWSHSTALSFLHSSASRVS